MEVNQSRRTRTTNSRASASPANSHNSGASTSTTSSTNPLATWIVAQLAEDIEAACGLQNLDKKTGSSLAELCNYRSYKLGQPECYGLKGSEKRRKISQKVRRWKKLSQDKYLDRLRQLGIIQFEARQGTQAQRTVDTDDIASSLQGLESLSIKAGSREDQEVSDLEEEEFEGPPLKTRKPRGTVQELPPRRAIMSSSSSSNRVVKIDSHFGGKGLLLAQPQSFVIGYMSLKLSFFCCPYPDL